MSYSLRYIHCLEKIVFILDIICDDMYCDGSITVMWSLNVFINDSLYLTGKQKSVL